MDGATATQSLRAFVSVCRGDPTFLGADADVGARTVEAIHLMHLSAKSGQVERG